MAGREMFARSIEDDHAYAFIGGGTLESLI